MQRGSAFWGVVLVVVGGVLLAASLLGMDAWKILGPSFLVVFGAWVLWGATRSRQPAPAQPLTILDEGASQGRITIRHGAGRLRITGGAARGELLAGTFAGGVDHTAQVIAGVLELKLQVPGERVFFWAPWIWPAGFDWNLQVTESLPVSIRLEAGAGDHDLDLTALQITDLRIQTGASSTVVRLPSRAGASRVRVESGLASVQIHVPEGVAARIRSRGGLSGIRLDRARFPRQRGYFQSPDYETAANKVDLDVQTGLGSVVIH
jgi:hypothetical protein